MAGLKKLEEELALPPGHVLLKAMDVRDSKGIADFIATIPGAMGGLHFCINCSGILGADYNNDIANQAEENWTMVRAF
jgi:NAD(P)-dependent dehydrogenase (short-subunit alcohol dehydrogenase family)